MSDSVGEGMRVRSRAAASLGLIALGLLFEVLSTPPGPVPWLVLVADAPFLGLLFLAGGRQWKRWVFLYALLHYAVACHWLARIHPVQVVGAAVVLSPLPVLAGLLIRALVRRGISLLIAAPTLLVFEELARTFWMGGMPLPSRALPFVEAWPGLASSAALFGAWGLVFLAGASSAWWLQVVTRRKRLALRSLVWVSTALLLVGFGSWWGNRDEHLVSTGDDVLLAVQGNVAQGLKHSVDAHAPSRVFETHLGLTARGLDSARAAGKHPFVVLWPETMVPWPFVGAELAQRYPDEWENQVRVVRNVRQTVERDGASPLVLLGVIHLFRRGDERQLEPAFYGNHDSLLLVDPNLVSPPGALYPEPPAVGGRAVWDLGRHDKHVLVPGGEYTPLGDVLVPLRFFRNLVSVIPELEPGAEEQTPFEIRPAQGDVPAVRAGTVICFELLFPGRCRHWRLAGANVLLNAANYGWFGDSGFRAQIRAMARLRAAETGTTVVVAGNTGPTLVYDPRGRAVGRFVDAESGVSGALEADASTFCEGWAWGEIILDAEPTPYVRWGDAPWWGLGVLLVFLGILRSLRPHDAPVTVPTYEECRSEGEGENL